jgi:hypothetical protein
MSGDSLKTEQGAVLSTKFFTNECGNSLFKKFKGAFEHIADIYAFHAVVGYFRASGYYAIREHLVKVPEVKILVGINVDVISAEAKRRGILFFGDPEKTRDEFIRWMREDIRQASYSKEVEEGIMQFMEDIVDGRIQIKVHKTKKLHAKIYVFLPKTFNEYSGGEVITGSSNLTDTGLGIKEESNYEFNVALRDYNDVHFAEKEFQKLWKDGEEVLPIDIGRIKHKSHLGQLFTPFEIYIKLLIEYFGRHIDYDPDTVGDLPKNFKKLSYQVDAVNQGYQMLLDHNGFILADVVGLGKTIIASMIAKRFIIANGSLSSKLLVVYPPHLEKNWKATFRQFGLDKHTKFISNGSLHKIISNNDEDYWPKEDYDLILVDEAHKFRNHKSIMFDTLQTICKAPRSIEGNVRGQRKKVILISATPLNNRPEDIYYQLQLFQDARKSTVPVTNLQTFFAPLIRQYKEVLAAARLNGRPNMGSLRGIYTSIRTKILETITVRRTRTDVKNYPAYLKDLKEQGIKFPDIADPGAIEYEKEFKRIKNLPLKARTGRKPQKQHKELKGGSLIFMKSPYKIEFYKVLHNGQLEALSFVAAAEAFEAEPSEVSEALPDWHYTHIEKAEQTFEHELFAANTDTVSGDQADAKTNQARKFLRELKADSQDEKFRTAAESLLFLLDKGTITNLSNELRKLRLKWDKGELKVHLVENFILAMAAKYVQNSNGAEEAGVLDAPALPLEVTQKPDIILSETFTL